MRLPVSADRATPKRLPARGATRVKRLAPSRRPVLTDMTTTKAASSASRRPLVRAALRRSAATAPRRSTTAAGTAAEKAAPAMTPGTTRSRRPIQTSRPKRTLVAKVAQRRRNPSRHISAIPAAPPERWRSTPCMRPPYWARKRRPEARPPRPTGTRAPGRRKVAPRAWSSSGRAGAPERSASGKPAVAMPARSGARAAKDMSEKGRRWRHQTRKVRAMRLPAVTCAAAEGRADQGEGGTGAGPEGETTVVWRDSSFMGVRADVEVIIRGRRGRGWGGAEGAPRACRGRPRVRVSAP